MDSSLNASLIRIQNILAEYVGIPLFVLGITGSLLNMFLFSQRKLRSNSCCTYFLASSIAALVLILIGISPYLYAVNNTPSPIFNKSFCKARAYVTQTSVMLIRWLLTIACIDRAFLTSSNIYLRSFSTVKNARRVVIAACIIWFLIPIHVLIYADVRIFGYTSCMMSSNEVAIYHTIYTIIAGGLLPSVIALVCTKIIWNGLKITRASRKSMTLKAIRNRRETRDVQVIIMLLIQVIIYVVCNFPFMLLNIFIAFTRSNINKSANQKSIELFLQFVTEFILYIYPVLTFYSNALASRSFRGILIHSIHRIFSYVRNEILSIRVQVVPSAIVLMNVRNG